MTRPPAEGIPAARSGRSEQSCEPQGEKGSRARLCPLLLPSSTGATPQQLTQELFPRRRRGHAGQQGGRETPQHPAPTERAGRNHRGRAPLCCPLRRRAEAPSAVDLWTLWPSPLPHLSLAQRSSHFPSSSQPRGSLGSYRPQRPPGRCGRSGDAHDVRPPLHQQVRTELRAGESRHSTFPGTPCPPQHSGASFRRALANPRAAEG